MPFRHLSIAVAAVIGLPGLLGVALGKSQAAALLTTCANLNRARTDQGMLRRDWVRGDVTGDGQADTVAIIEDKRAPLRCRFGVIVYSRKQAFVFPLGAHFIGKPGEVIGQPWPLIRLLARIDHRPGAAILVALARGASFEWGELLTLRGGQLRQIRLPGSDGGYFMYGAHVPAGTNFDCPRAGSGEIVRASFSVLDTQSLKWRYQLDRYRLVGASLRLTKVRAVVLRANIKKHQYPRVPRWWDRYDAELNPFAHCAIAKHGPPT